MTTRHDNDAPHWGINRVTSTFKDRVGYRLLLPIFAIHGRRYSISMDDWLTGWWFLSFSIAVERYAWNGVGLRINWGLVPSRGCRLDAGRAEVYARIDHTTGAWRA